MRIVMFLFLQGSANVPEALLQQILILGLWISVVLSNLCQTFVDYWVTKLPPSLLGSIERGNGLRKIVILGQRNALK